MQFHISCKISVEFSASSFCLSFGNVKIILNNPNPTLNLWLLPGKDVYFHVRILTLFVSISIEYFGVCFATFSLSLYFNKLNSKKRIFINNFRDQVLSVFIQLLLNWLCHVRIIKTFDFLHRASWELKKTFNYLQFLLTN